MARLKVSDVDAKVDAVAESVARLETTLGTILDAVSKLQPAERKSRVPDGSIDYEGELEASRRVLAQAEMVDIVHESEEPRNVRWNGVKYVLYPGTNRVPKPIAEVYQRALDDELEGERRREALSGYKETTIGELYANSQR